MHTNSICIVHVRPFGMSYWTTHIVMYFYGKWYICLQGFLSFICQKVDTTSNFSSDYIWIGIKLYMYINKSAHIFLTILFFWRYMEGLKLLVCYKQQIWFMFENLFRRRLDWYHTLHIFIYVLICFLQIILLKTIWRYMGGYEICYKQRILFIFENLFRRRMDWYQSSCRRKSQSFPLKEGFMSGFVGN